MYKGFIIFFTKISIVFILITMFSCESSNLPTELNNQGTLMKSFNQEIIQDAATTYSWETEYYNNGNGKIEGWNIRSSDRFIAGYYYYGSGTTATDEPLMIVIHPNDFYGVFNKVGHFSDFRNYSSIGGWQISSFDKYSSFVGNGNRLYLFAVNHSSYWAALIYNHPSAGWMMPWSNSGNDWIGGWSNKP